MVTSDRGDEAAGRMHAASDLLRATFWAPGKVVSHMDAVRACEDALAILRGEEEVVGMPRAHGSAAPSPADEFGLTPSVEEQRAKAEAFFRQYNQHPDAPLRTDQMGRCPPKGAEPDTGSDATTTYYELRLAQERNRLLEVQLAHTEKLHLLLRIADDYSEDPRTRLDRMVRAIVGREGDLNR